MRLEVVGTQWLLAPITPVTISLKQAPNPDPEITAAESTLLSNVALLLTTHVSAHRVKAYHSMQYFSPKKLLCTSTVLSHITNWFSKCAVILYS